MFYVLNLCLSLFSDSNNISSSSQDHAYFGGSAFYIMYVSRELDSVTMALINIVYEGHELHKISC